MKSGIGSDHTVEYCRSLLEFNNSKIAEIDNKASFLSGISSVVFVLIAGFVLDRFANAPWWEVVLVVFTLGALVVSFWYAMKVVIPATVDTQVTYTEPTNDFFCQYITDRSREIYRSDIADRDIRGAIENYTNEVYTLAEILKDKYRDVRYSSNALLWAIVSAST